MAYNRERDIVYIYERRQARTIYEDVEQGEKARGNDCLCCYTLEQGDNQATKRAREETCKGSGNCSRS